MRRGNVDFEHDDISLPCSLCSSKPDNTKSLSVVLLALGINQVIATANEIFFRPRNQNHTAL